MTCNLSQIKCCLMNSEKFMKFHKSFHSTRGVPLCLSKDTIPIFNIEILIFYKSMKICINFWGKHITNEMRYIIAYRSVVYLFVFNFLSNITNNLMSHSYSCVLSTPMSFSPFLSISVDIEASGGVSLCSVRFSRGKNVN